MCIRACVSVRLHVWLHMPVEHTADARQHLVTHAHRSVKDELDKAAPSPHTSAGWRPCVALLRVVGPLTLNSKTQPLQLIARIQRGGLDQHGCKHGLDVGWPARHCGVVPRVARFCKASRRRRRRGIIVRRFLAVGNGDCTTCEQHQQSRAEPSAAPQLWAMHPPVWMPMPCPAVPGHRSCAVCRQASGLCLQA